MLRPRVIPILQLLDGRLVKTRNFKDPVYIGDPVNAARIYNDLQADELCVLDIWATAAGCEPDYATMARIADRLFMPLACGGGIKTLESAKRLFDLGVERVILNTAAIEDPELLTAIAEQYGAQAVTVSLDVRLGPSGYQIACTRGGKRTGLKAEMVVSSLVEWGAGEILLQNVDLDGTMRGYNLDLIRRISGAVSVPVIAAGGAGNSAHFTEALEAGASAVAAGSMFVFHGPHKAVLIQYEALT
jgi:cyclase